MGQSIKRGSVEGPLHARIRYMIDHLDRPGVIHHEQLSVEHDPSKSTYTVCDTKSAKPTSCKMYPGKGYAFPSADKPAISSDAQDKSRIYTARTIKDAFNHYVHKFKAVPGFSSTMIVRNKRGTADIILCRDSNKRPNGMLQSCYYYETGELYGEVFGPRNAVIARFSQVQPDPNAIKIPGDDASQTQIATKSVE